MNYKEFIQKYEELLNSGYCECNELNCLDNNPPKKILNIMKEQQQEIERLNNMIERLNNQLQQKDNIIKEVREYIENNDLYEQDYDYDYEENLVVGPPSDETARKILLEILDKVEE